MLMMMMVKVLMLLLLLLLLLIVRMFLFQQNYRFNRCHQAGNRRHRNRCTGRTAATATVLVVHQHGLRFRQFTFPGHGTWKALAGATLMLTHTDHHTTTTIRDGLFNV
uniref:Putative secreted peptide n=1 Tax=Anopheles braziliensis TaxID=58242 RepID=A0A2M3ZSP3_9DIPT